MALMCPSPLNALRSTLQRSETSWQKVDRRFSGFALAFFADAEEIEAMTCYNARNELPDPVMEVLLWRKVKIFDDAAAFALEVIVPIDRRIVPMKPFAEIEFLDLSL
jgi:hypothetical protein